MSKFYLVKIERRWFRRSRVVITRLKSGREYQPQEITMASGGVIETTGKIQLSIYGQYGFRGINFRGEKLL